MNSNIVEKLGLKRPLIVAPMAGGPSSPELVASASAAGALGSMGAAYSTPEMMSEFVQKVRAKTDRPFAINLFIQNESPQVSPAMIARALQATAFFREELSIPEPSFVPPFEESFDPQFEMVLCLKPAVLSYVFGLLGNDHARAAKAEGIYLIGTATSLDEALELESSGADAVVLQGIEAGGHRGIFDSSASDPSVKAFDLLRACVGQVNLPLIAAGGIMTRDEIASALKFGAQAVQMGTAFLACAEAGTSAPYKRELLKSGKRETKTTRAFSGRLARGLQNKFMMEMDLRPESILPFPAQNKFTRDMRNASVKMDSSEFLSLWAGAGAGELWQGSCADLISALF